MTIYISSDTASAFGLDDWIPGTAMPDAVIGELNIFVDDLLAKMKDVDANRTDDIKKQLIMGMLESWDAEISLIPQSLRQQKNQLRKYIIDNYDAVSKKHSRRVELLSQELKKLCNS